MLRPASIALLSAALVALAGAPRAVACVLPPPQQVRSVVPFDGQKGVPTNARPRVTYASGVSGASLCGAKPGAPTIRLAPGDGGAPDGGAGDEVPGAWVRATDDDPRASAIWEFRPAGALQARTTYELVDAYPATCNCPKGTGCVAGAAAVFARFTTGDSPDLVPPTFSGIDSAQCSHQVCTATQSTCCGPYNHLTWSVLYARDASDDNLVGVRLYLRKDADAYDFTHPVGPPQVSDPPDGPLTTSWDVQLTPGTYHVLARAFDLAGNEDDNTVEASFVFPLAADVQCRKALADAGPDPDLVFVYPDGYFTGGDAATSLPVQTGCGCHLGARAPAPPVGALALLVGVVALLASRRQRRAWCPSGR